MFSHDSAVLGFLRYNLPQRCVRILLPFLGCALKKGRFDFICKVFVEYRTLVINLQILKVPVSPISQRLV